MLFSLEKYHLFMDFYEISFDSVFFDKKILFDLHCLTFYSILSSGNNGPFDDCVRDAVSWRRLIFPGED